jgi:hypothetical protein
VRGESDDTFGSFRPLGGGRHGAASLPQACALKYILYHGAMQLINRKALPHQVPLWVNPQNEIYFITINCKERFRNQLALPEVSTRLFETVRHRQEKYLWWPHLFLLMPDHLHALLSFPPSGKPMRLVISKWKEWTAKEI